VLDGQADDDEYTPGRTREVVVEFDTRCSDGDAAVTQVVSHRVQWSFDGVSWGTGTPGSTELGPRRWACAAKRRLRVHRVASSWSKDTSVSTSSRSKAST
jgi:hypothetical protein